MTSDPLYPWGGIFLGHLDLGPRENPPVGVSLIVYYHGSSSHHGEASHGAPETVGVVGHVA